MSNRSLSGNVLPLQSMPKMPKLEDGFTRIANEIIEAMMLAKLNGRQCRVLLAVIRKTYGYGKKEDDMSASQIGALVDMKRNHVTEVLNELESMRIICKRQGAFGMIIGINKNITAWGDQVATDSPESVTSPELRIVPNPVRTSPESGTKVVPSSGHTKENQKKTNKRKINAQSSIALPDWLPAEAWADWEEHRKSKRAKMTLKAAQLCIKKLDQYRAQGQSPQDVINHCIENGWTGLFAPKNQSNKSGEVKHGNFGTQDYRAGVTEDGSF